MNDEQPLHTLIREALSLAAPDRLPFLEARCGEDSTLLARARRMLADQEAVTQADGAPSLAPSSPLDTLPPRLPARLGSYRILDLLGEGGMGVVYLAEQDRPRRIVALKVIRPGLVTPRTLRRFELEAQTLGRLQHPGIAQVYEAGSLGGPGGDAQPYFAMEHIRGRPPGEHALATGLGTRGKIALFIKVCDAVQHAHQRGVIHRDLKPSNILVTPEGEPKILDFGVAKLTDADDAAGALRTDAGQVLGTVPYMSPEQIAGRPGDVDTRSDVYTLGVILFELLGGRLPHALSGRTIFEASRIINTQEAPRLGSLSGEFRGDLEIIVAKAVEKDRDRRYQSPADLAADLRRFLADEPIVARRAGMVYQLNKFARRNRPAVAAGAVAVLVLIAGAVAVSWQAVEATRGRDLAERMRESADRAKAAAVQEAATATQINSLLTEMLQAADPDVSLGKELTVAEALDRTAASIDARVRDPRVLASVRSTLAAAYQSLNKLAQAEEQAVIALSLWREHSGPDSSTTLAAMRRLANVHADQGRFPDAEPLAAEALRLTRDRRGDDPAEVVAALVDLSRVLHESGRVKEAAAVLDEALQLGLDKLGERDERTLFAMHNMASSLKDRGRFDEAVELFTRVIALRRGLLGPDHTTTLSSMNNLAATLQRAGRNEEALDLFRAVHETRRRILGDAHAATVTSLSNISVCLVALARLDEAEPLLRAALDGYTRVAGESHTKTLVTMANLAYLEEERGRDPEAEALYRRVIGLRTAAGNPGEPELLSVMNNLASLLQRRGDPAAAERVFADLCARCRGSLPAGHYLCAIFENNHGDCLIDLGRGTEAEPLLRSSLGALRATFGDHHPRAVKARARLDRLGVEDHPSAEPPVSPTPTRSANDSVSNPG